jgi:ATP-dependent DNA helicase DinG
VVQARARAQVADIVVVNHHLLLADLALKQEGFGEILPGAQAFVVDEAHQLPDLAAQFFGEGIGARPLVELARDAIGECKDVAGTLAAVQAPAQRLEHATRVLRAAMDVLPTRGTRGRALHEAPVRDACEQMLEALQGFVETLAPLRDASPGFERAMRARWISRRLRRWLRAGGGDFADDALTRRRRRSSDERRLLVRTLAARLPLPAHAARCVRPAARTPRAIPAAWVFTSATLSVAGRFDHLRERLGLDDPTTLLEPSPFDWQRRRCATCRRACPSRCRATTARRRRCAAPVLEASAAAPSCCSPRTARCAKRPRPARRPVAVVRAGRCAAPRAAAALPRIGNGVLLGAASFREGVDVAGDALSVVVIDKLPFAAPDDPVFEARLDASAARRQSLPRRTTAAGRDRAEAGRGPAHPQRDRPRRAGAVRPAPGRQELRPHVLRIAAAVRDDPRRGGRPRRSLRQNPSTFPSRSTSMTDRPRRVPRHWRRVLQGR